MKKIKTRPWYPYAVALCIGVLLYVILMHLPGIAGGLKSLGRVFNTVVIGCIVAYLMNPLAMLFERKVFKGLKKGSWIASVFLAFLTFAAVIVALVFILIPQLANSITAFIENLPKYQNYIHSFFEKLGLTGLIYIPETAEEVVDKFNIYMEQNGGDISALVLGLVKNTVNIAIGAVLAIYLLTAKDALKKDFKTLLEALMSDEKYKHALSFLRRCNYILNRYLVFSLLDSIIVGGINALIMIVLRIPNAGLISVIVAITNLIPTFGPVIGAVIGAFLLLLEGPKYAVMFIIITLILQICDGYIIKPKLFGNSLGVSGLLILLAIVTLGNAFGVGGILLAIPIAAICDFAYREELLPFLKKRKEQELTS